MKFLSFPDRIDDTIYTRLNENGCPWHRVYCSLSRAEVDEIRRIWEAAK